jgi:hypothetical protein
MKKVIMLAAVCALCLTKTMAQSDSKKFSFGFGFEGGIPTGSASNLYNFAVGITIRFSYHVGPGFVTLTGGGIGYDPKSIEGQPKKVGLQIPVRAGYKYIIHHFFVMGEVGYSEFKSYYGQNGDLVSNSQGSLIVAPTVGINFGAFEAGLRYGMDLRSGGGGLFGARIGFNF